MKQTSGPRRRAPAETVIKDIRRATRRQVSAEEKIRIVLEGLRGEESIAELCRREGISSSMYDGWSKDVLEAGKRRRAGDTARAATSDEVKELRREASALKEVVADLRGVRPRWTTRPATTSSSGRSGSPWRPTRARRTRPDSPTSCTPFA